MSVKLTISVADIATTLLAGYTYIKVYRSASELGSYFEITIPAAMIELETGVSDYEFTDVSGTTEHWYKTTFYDQSIPAESIYSDSFQGDYIDSNFSTASYPEEGIFTSLDRLTIDKIRNFIGDKKELTRDYVSAISGYSTLSEDGYSHALSNPKGWPLQVKLDGNYYTTLNNPKVNDYQFITFSGTAISTVSGTLDVWYYHFRYSDAEIMTTFNSLTPPFPLEASDVTMELAVICAAIELSFAELSYSSVNAGVEVDIYEEIRINPKAGLDSRYSNLKRLMDLRDAIIAAILGDDGDIYGVLID